MSSTTPRTGSSFSTPACSSCSSRCCPCCRLSSTLSWWMARRTQCPAGYPVTLTARSCPTAPLSSTGRNWTRHPRRRCATPAAPRATPRVSSTATAPRSSTPWRPGPPIPLASVNTIASCYCPRCSTPTAGACPTAAGSAAAISLCRDRTCNPRESREWSGPSDRPSPPWCRPSSATCCARRTNAAWT